MKEENVVSLFETPYIKIYDLQYEEGAHYFDATRRSQENLLAVKTDETFKHELPDAVSCVVVLDIEGQQPQLCVTKEYRYPIGRFLLSVPSGLIDDKDKDTENPIFSASFRELQEETGIRFQPDTDEIQLINPMLLCSPGMTDECTAVVKITLHRKHHPHTCQDGAEGTEVFDGIKWITKEEAKRFLLQGSDNEGIYYSAITWISLTTFLSDIW